MSKIICSAAIRGAHKIVERAEAKYKEALDLLQKSWDMRMERAHYNHIAYLHLEAAKKAVAEQKK